MSICGGCLDHLHVSKAIATEDLECNGTTLHHPIFSIQAMLAPKVSSVLYFNSLVQYCMISSTVQTQGRRVVYLQ